MIKKYVQFNEELFKWRSDNEFKFKIQGSPSESESKKWIEFKGIFDDCFSDIVDEYPVSNIRIGFGVRYPVMTCNITMNDFLSKSESILICNRITDRINMVDGILNLKDKFVKTKVHYILDGIVSSKHKLTGGEFFICDLIEVWEVFGKNGKPSNTAFFFSVLNPYYSEFNYGK